MRIRAIGVQSAGALGVDRLSVLGVDVGRPEHANAAPLMEWSVARHATLADLL